MSAQSPETTLATRRAILAAGLSGCALAALPVALGSESFIAALRRLLAPSSTAPMQHIETAQAVLAGAPGTPFALGRLSNAHIVARIRQNIANDYSQGRIVNVSGWRLAATECNVLELLRQLRLA